MQTTVSVVMPCFNARPYVRAAVESVLKQSWQHLELLVIDDGSTDGSIETLADIKDIRLRIIRQKNSGQCAACNRGLEETSGELVKFFDADDLMDPDLLYKQVLRLNGRMDAIAFGEWQRFTASPARSDQFEPRRMYRDATPIDWLLTEWSDARPMMQCGLFLIPRPILNIRGNWDVRLSLINDFEFFARVLLGATELLYSKGARLHYRSGIASSLSGQRNRRAVESAYLSLLLGTQHLLNAENSPRTRAVAANVLQDFEYCYYPHHPDLRASILARVKELGGSSLQPDGPPGFQQLRRFTGWKIARRVQYLVEEVGLNRAARSKGPKDRTDK